MNVSTRNGHDEQGALIEFVGQGETFEWATTSMYYPFGVEDDDGVPVGSAKVILSLTQKEALKDAFPKVNRDLIDCIASFKP